MNDNFFPSPSSLELSLKPWVQIGHNKNYIKNLIILEGIPMKNNKTPLAAAMSTVVVSALTATTANAETNPFAMTEMSEGYMQVAEASYNIVPWGGKKAKKANEASCGEGKCGGMMDGDKMKKGMESSCGAMMKGKEGACGAMDNAESKAAEAKCGEGKCGSMMDGDKMKKGQESSCGAMMKGKEGACGEMKGGMGGMDMKGGEMSCGAMMEKMKGKMGGMDMKGGEMSCGSKIDPAKAAGK